MTDPVEDFAAAAATYCAWCAGPAGEPEDEVRAAQRYLGRLYALALELGLDQGAIHGHADPEGAHCDDARWQAIFRRFAALPFGYYSEVVDPQELERPQTSIGDVGDDLADVFRDLDAGLGLYRDGHNEAALWHWASRYFHRGRHAVGALLALHQWRERAAGSR